MKTQNQKAMEKIETFKQLVRGAESHATSDLAYEVRGLLLFAEQRASEEEIEEFMEGLGEAQDLFSIVPQNSVPSDYFECAQLLTWEDMREVYETEGVFFHVHFLKYSDQPINCFRNRGTGLWCAAGTNADDIAWETGDFETLGELKDYLDDNEQEYLENF